jgi:hypothetical protein
VANWAQLYGIAAAIGGLFGLLVALGLLPVADGRGDPFAGRLLAVAGGVAVGVLLAAVAHLGVRWQLRRRTRRAGD